MLQSDRELPYRLSCSSHFWMIGTSAPLRRLLPLDHQEAPHQGCGQSNPAAIKCTKT